MNVKCYFIVVLFVLAEVIAFSQNKTPYYYKYQAGLEIGPGDNSSPGTSFPFGGNIGASIRIKNQVFGFRTCTFSELKLFGSPTYYNQTGPFYGYAFQKKNVSLIPQASLGLFKTNYKQTTEYSGLGFELSATATLHYRGLGVGLRPLFNINHIESYVGFVFHLVLGWEWSYKT